jgi:signal transduction histidine kinase
MVVGTAWLAGRAIRERDLVARRLAERAEELEREREAFATLSVRYERARIASELHDIVAHAISVMVVQAGAGQRIAAVDPELTGEMFDAIAGAARQAEQDMTQLVALLSDEDAIGHAPDLTLVEELVARAAGTGLDVTLRLEGSREGLPASAVQTVYRVVRESLTNALRYASGAPVHVLVRGGAGAIDVEVVNDPADDAADLAGHGTGNGLRGLRERVGASGGRLEAGPRESGGWRVAARIPCIVPVGVEDAG